MSGHKHSIDFERGAAAYRGRFAPSPTGDLHAGSLLAAFGSWLLARRHGGQWLVRIEDLDPPREVPGAAQRQLDALSAFGLLSDGPVVRQSQRHALYAASLQRLLDADQAFVCHCSRSDLAASGGVHRRCVAHGPRVDHAAPQAAVRLRVADGATVEFDDGVLGRQRQDVAREVGDFVLRRADGHWAYQLAVVVDDADQGISDIVRGADLLDSTPRQILLQRALGLPTPAYAHLPLLLDAHGRKLSKSEAAHPLDPADPLPALRAAWAALGQAPQALVAVETVTQLLSAACDSFSPAQIPQAASSLAAMHNDPGTNAV
ncbi:tRNA glutamyl-Q(34) synthetase GluQRS [Lysobacter enzymogenes]|uniref:tRNA glutamyl-Q(34) synthetase GluQRS n=1 Tax=Lysobacter enzymogenes TaxID=69 RepID=UPI001F601231|nr:tRNA glutamyl-Q(34) synthetase GluQRS [Lysobacter enzymogenes]